MNYNNLLNEEKLSQSKEKVLHTGTIMIIIGVFAALIGLIMVFVYDWTELIILIVVGFLLAFWGLSTKLMEHNRELMTNMFNQQVSANKEDSKERAKEMAANMKEFSKTIDEIMKNHEK